MNRRIPQSNTPIAQQPPDIPSEGFAVVGRPARRRSHEGARPASDEIHTESPRTVFGFGGFLHPLFLLPDIQCTLACFCRRLRQSAIMAMNSEFVGLPLMFETV